MGLLSVIEKVRKPGPLSVKNQGIQTGAEGRKRIGRKSFAKVSRNGIKTENPFEGRLWPESKLNGKEAGFIVRALFRLLGIRWSVFVWRDA